MDALRQDLRFAARSLGRASNFSFLMILSLALGIGLNTAVYSVVNGVLLRPLRYDDPDRLVYLSSNGDPPFPASLPNFRDWEAKSTSFLALAAYSAVNVNLTGRSTAERAGAVLATDRLFEVLGVVAAIGRTWASEASGDAGVVLGWRLWESTFGGDRFIVGKSVTIDGVERTVVGIMPPGFRFGDADLWLRVPTDSPAERGNFYLGVVGRLRAGISLESAQAEQDALGERLAVAFPNRGVGARVQPLQNVIVGDIDGPLRVLMGAVAFVLLVACVNAASLMLARGNARTRELALRRSLGASGSRLVRQLLTEAVLTSLAAGMLGLFLAAWGTEVLLKLIPGALPRADEFSMDASVLAFTAGISVLSAMLFGTAPALRAAGGSPAPMLFDGGRTTAGPQRHRTRRALVVAEIALTLVPLAGALMLIRSLERLLAVDPGFRPEQVLTATFSLPRRLYDQPDRVWRFNSQLIQRIASIPDVQSVGIISHPPLGNDNAAGSFEVMGRIQQEGTETPWTQMRAATPGYLEAAGIPRVEGRAFTENDVASQPWVAIVDETFAARYFGNTSPIGQRIRMGFDPEHPREIVGVIGSIHHSSLQDSPEPHIYFPFAQQPLNDAAIFIRAHASPVALAPVLRQAARDIDPGIPLYRVRTLQQAVFDSAARPRFNALLVAVFALAALLIAAAGVFAVASQSVAERKKDMAIRIALGARPGHIVRMVVGEALPLTAAGVGIGCAAVLALAQTLAGMLFETRIRDPLLLALASGLLALVALSAYFLPARKAGSVDPVTALSDT